MQYAKKEQLNTMLFVSSAVFILRAKKKGTSFTESHTTTPHTLGIINKQATSFFIQRLLAGWV